MLGLTPSGISSVPCSQGDVPAGAGPETGTGMPASNRHDPSGCKAALYRNRESEVEATPQGHMNLVPVSGSRGLSQHTPVKSL